VPVAAYAFEEEGRLRLHGRVSAPDGSQAIDVHGERPASEALALGAGLAAQALARGAAELLRGVS
jgi:hydroxymethylbilane synthase